MRLLCLDCLTSAQFSYKSYKKVSLRKNKCKYQLDLQCRSKGNITGRARERWRREPLGGSGMLPQKILKAGGLEMLFPAFSKSDM